MLLVVHRVCFCKCLRQVGVTCSNREQTPRHRVLGGYPDVSLSQARVKARRMRTQINSGRDPIAEPQGCARSLDPRTAFTRHVCRSCPPMPCLKVQEFRNKKHAAQWINTLETYAFPKIGELPVSKIETPQVLSVLKPIWSEKHETTSRLRQLIATVFDHAIASKVRTLPNPANWKGCLEPLLPNRKNQKQESHVTPRGTTGRSNKMPLFMAHLPGGFRNWRDCPF